MRYHNIQFVQKLVPLMQKVMPAESLAEHIKSLVDTFAELLMKTDISAYDIQIRAGKNFTNMGGGDEEDEGQTHSHKPSQDKENEEVKLVINQEIFWELWWDYFDPEWGNGPEK